ncbi:hypothetical protein RHGRI_018600 [Rhododendron griersonianum]|uniref:GAG-pre-integrase domain-containing protein n=1 Tax=Rhododendron griersonianum TaxID=479676 RepID=A0AAV6K217_9ERIC|nr:hypothetical protein RHGRI_018600 [Rhododendron griersonianum]
MHVASIGSILSSTAPSLSIPNVFYVPQLSLSLLSISQLSDSGFDVVFSSSGCVVQDRDSKKQIGAGRRVGDLYLLEHLHLPIKPSSTAASSFCLDHKSSPFYIWHSRLGHLSSERLKLLVQAGHLGHISVSDISECSGSKEDLIHIDPFPMDMDVPPEEYTSTLTVSDISTAPSASPRHAPITQVYTRRPTSTAAPQSASTDPDPPVRKKGNSVKIKTALKYIGQCACVLAANMKEKRLSE